MTKNINWKIGGQAGFGIMSVGRLFAKTCLRHGWQVFCYTEYPSLIRGGHNTYQVHSDKQTVTSQKNQIDVLIALDELTIKQHQDELADGGVIIYDSEKITPPSREAGQLADKKAGLKYLEVPLGAISKEICNSDLMKNTIALGVSLGLYECDLSILNDLIKEEFSDKSQAVIEQNLTAAQRGYEFIKNNALLRASLPKLDKVKAPERILITGNEAVGLGAIACGCKFYVAYPMTPATSILHFMAKYERDYDLMVKQAEDEIAVINMAIGASFAGVRSLCATSGGGFDLMSESLGFAAIAEIPLVAVLSQRVGPATGLPTWTAQAELLYAIHAGHGEFLRVVIAPGDATEAFWATVIAFNLAEKYQLPVIILLDKYLSESQMSTEQFDLKKVKIDRGQLLTQEQLNKITNYKRYQFTKSGVSPRSLPGMKGGIYQANSDEHDEYGFSTEAADIKVKMAEKRAVKISGLLKDLPEPIIYGPKNAKKTILCWGSTKLTVLEALKELKDTRIIHLQYLWPFPSDFIKKNIDPDKSIIIEGNQTGQLQQLIKLETGLDIKKTLLKYDGRPFYPEEIFKIMINF